MFSNLHGRTRVAGVGIEGGISLQRRFRQSIGRLRVEVFVILRQHVMTASSPQANITCRARRGNLEQRARAHHHTGGGRGGTRDVLVPD
jgi:hypothetical protein